MLLRFSVENHLSFCERQELLFAASSLEDRTDGLIPCKAVPSGAVVPAVVIYGSNASGKTNFVDAVSTMRQLVLWSQTRGEPGSRVPRHEFLLDPRFSEKPSCFEIDFVLDNIRYHYGFETTDKAITSEWLYEIPKAHRRKLYERAEQKFEFGRWLKGQNRIIARLTRPNSLFLSAAAQYGHERLSRVYKYFQDLEFSASISVPGVEASSWVREDRIDGRVIKFLESINTGVIGYRKKETEVSEEARALRREFRIRTEKHIGRTNWVMPDGEDKFEEIELSHRGKGGEVVHLDLQFESAGTRRLLIILSKSFKAIDNGIPVFIDELDASLHTYACDAILRMFCSPEVNENGAQLIATTHDTNLMKCQVLRRDQLWFAQKSSEGATELYPLTDFRTRKGDNIERGYLQGRYGAVPFDEPVTALLES